MINCFSFLEKVKEVQSTLFACDDVKYLRGNKTELNPTFAEKKRVHQTQFCPKIKQRVIIFQNKNKLACKVIENL